MNLIRRFWDHLVFVLTLSCEKATRLMSESMERKLTLVERLAMYGHILSCKSSRRFRKQLIGIQRQLHEMGGEEYTKTMRDEAIAFRLSASARDRIRNRVDEALTSSSD